LSRPMRSSNCLQASVSVKSRRHRTDKLKCTSKLRVVPRLVRAIPIDLRLDFWRWDQPPERPRPCFSRFMVFFLLTWDYGAICSNK
jgi:hypothetical protein